MSTCYYNNTSHTHTHTHTHTQFEIVPVGTNGFRSPESSMHTIANTPEVFSPPLTTKTDIYSFGILAMRLMISTDTPYSQRSMAMLLLHYHQIRTTPTGRTAGQRRLNYLRIGEDTTLKLLKVNM